MSQKLGRSLALPNSHRKKLGAISFRTTMAWSEDQAIALCLFKSFYRTRLLHSGEGLSHVRWLLGSLSRECGEFHVFGPISFKLRDFRLVELFTSGIVEIESSAKSLFENFG